jgi:diguanylate cyclase (GGDEF)-like protein
MFRVDPLRARLLVVILLAVLPMAGLSLYDAERQRADNVAAAKAAALREFDRLAHEYDRVVGATRQLLALLARLEALRGPECDALLASVLADNALYANLAVVDRDGVSHCSAVPIRIPVPAGDRPYVRHALERGEFAVSGYQIGRITRRASVNFAIPMRDVDGEVIGAVIAAVDVERLAQLAEDWRLFEGAAFVIMDRAGRLLVQEPPAGARVGEPLPDADLAARLLGTADAEGGFEHTGADGVPRLFVHRALRGISTGGDAGVLVYAGIPLAPLTAEADRALRRQLLLLALTLAVVMSVAWLGGDALVLRAVSRAFISLRRRADTDTLTGLANRASFFDAARRAFNAARLQRRRLTLAILDLDHFKRVNDRHGHPVGDAVLARFADRLRSSVREGDVCGRIGGEEFAVLLPDATHALASRIAERIRAAVAASAADGLPQVTVSVGLAAVDDGTPDVDALTRRADAALYAAKSAGRDRVEWG